jgi:hypothetical protein
MESDTQIFIWIVVVTVAIVVLFAAVVAHFRNKKYILFANNTTIKTRDGQTYNMADLQKIKFLNKYIIGKGTQTATVALHFYFSSGKAVIDRRSNIFEEVIHHVATLNVHKETVITKGLLREKQK